MNRQLTLEYKEKLSYFSIEARYKINKWLYRAAGLKKSQQSTIAGDQYDYT